MLRLWLVLIKRRLSGRQKIRNPFNGECQRDVPCAIFEALKAAVHSSDLDEFNEPNCYISSDRKASVISFTSLTSVVNLFTVLSGYTCMEVKQYFARNLKSNGKAGLIVNQVKDFALIYKYKKGQLIINFNFGIWNANDSTTCMTVMFFNDSGGGGGHVLQVYVPQNTTQFS